MGLQRAFQPGARPQVRAVHPSEPRAWRADLRCS